MGERPGVSPVAASVHCPRLVTIPICAERDRRITRTYMHRGTRTDTHTDTTRTHTPHRERHRHEADHLFPRWQACPAPGLAALAQVEIVAHQAAETSAEDWVHAAVVAGDRNVPLEPKHHQGNRRKQKDLPLVTGRVWIRERAFALERTCLCSASQLSWSNRRPQMRMFLHGRSTEIFNKPKRSQDLAVCWHDRAKDIQWQTFVSFHAFSARGSCRATAAATSE